MVQWVIWGKVQYWIWNPHRISKLKRKKNIQIGPYTRNLTFVVQRVICGKVQYRIWKPYRISKSKKKKNIQINKEIGLLLGGVCGCQAINGKAPKRNYELPWRMKWIAIGVMKSKSLKQLDLISQLQKPFKRFLPMEINRSYKFFTKI